MSEIDLMAEFDNGQPYMDQESVEIDIEFVDDYEEAMAEAAEAMDVGVDEIELIGVNVYAHGTNLQALADKVDWSDLLTTNKEEVITDFLALDSETEQIIVLHLMNHHGISLRESLDSFRDEFVRIYHDENEIVAEWIELNEIPHRAAYYLDKDRVLKDEYGGRDRLADGDIIVVER